MYGIYANIGGIWMVNVTIYIPYMDPMGYTTTNTTNNDTHNTVAYYS